MSKAEALYTGKQGAYDWLEAAGLSFRDVLRCCPEFVLRKYLVINAFDGGPLELARAEFNRGWLRHGKLALNPSVQSVEEIPGNESGEWYVFAKTPLFEAFKVFVNDPSFSLRDPQQLLLEAAPSRGGDDAEAINGLQELFWLQLELKGAETYISAGNRFILATRQTELYSQFIESITQNPEQD